MPLKQNGHPALTALTWGLILIILHSCTVVRKYDPAKPFIFENKVNIRGGVEKDKKADLKTDLEKQIEDSVAVLSATKIPWPKAPWIIPVPTIVKPMSFDSVNVEQSTVNMQNLLISRGYRRAEVGYDSSLTVKKDQQRITVNYEVEAGKLYRIDSVAYNINDSSLLKLIADNKEKPVLQKGDAFNYGAVDEELNRMVNLFKSNGYYKISREDFFVEADSGFAALVDPTIDPFEYIRRLAEIEERRKENPLVDLYIRQYPVRDSTKLLQYRVGNFIVYADAPAETSLDMRDTTQTMYNGFKIISFKNTFRPDFIARFIELRPGEIYNQDNFSKTLNNLNRLGAWQNINIIPRANDSTATIDYFLRLTPAKKQFFSVDLEGSSVLNSNQLVLIGAGRVGLAVNFRLRNRNIGRRAIQLENTVRTGIEFNNFSQILSSEITFGNRFTIPWLMTPFTSSFEKKFQSARTIVTLDFSYINRFQYYELRTINTFFGYEWKPRNNVTWQFKPFNIELTRIRQDALFQEAIQQNPLLVYAYNNGLVVGNNISYLRNFNRTNSSRRYSTLRLFGEESGLLLGTIFRQQTAKGRVFGDLYRFLKFDVDFRHYINNKNSSWVFRGFAGYGIALETANVDRQGEITLPFFKSYFAGGPNSMRGWQIRKLGIGSNIYFDTLVNGAFNDKYADMQIEANIEHRFNLFRLFGFWFRGAVFTDIGNIWFRSDINGQLPGADFNLSRLYRDLAIAGGFGLRMDFSYFLLRFDWGFPLKDPRYGPEAGKDQTSFYSPKKNGWFVDGVWNKPMFQFAIGYPF